jgi:6-methylsalicylate decarboxylase
MTVHHRVWDGATRRRFLASLATAAALVPARGLLAATRPRRIDVHHHFFAPGYMEAWAEYAQKHKGEGPPPPVQQWSIARSLEEMDKNGVGTAILSLSSTPGVWFENDAAGAQRIARLCNDYAAGMMRDHKGRFGLFAALPMLGVDDSLKEIDYAFGTLKADGIGLATSYGDKWPGDPAFDPILAELDRRKAVVALHPRSPNCCGNLIPWVPAGLIEYPNDTGRAALSLLFSGSLVKYRNIRWIFPQNGGTVPMLAGRVTTLSKSFKNLHEVAPDGVEAELKRHYYETANSAYAPTMAALLKFVPASHVLFGTDYPYVTVTQNATDLDKIGLPAGQLQAIDNGTAKKLFPQLTA